MDDTDLPHAFLGHIQRQCLLCIALDLGKIYEFQKRNPLNSIPGILEALKDAAGQPEAEAEAAKFCGKYGVDYSDRTESIRAAFRLFYTTHNRELEMMKKARDKYVAHSEYSYSPEALPSHHKFETLWEFGRDFYECISVGWIGVYPILFSRHASMSFFRHMESAVGKKLKFDF